MKYYLIKFKDIQGEKTMYMTQRDLTIFLFDFSRDIELISVQATRRRFRKEQEK
jgi:hypothetical protein